MLAVIHEKKDKVRPVLDFREMNEFMECSGADADVCGEKLRLWRQKPTNSALLDLHDKYIQINVDRDCCRYQIVKLKMNFTNYAGLDLV